MATSSSSLLSDVTPAFNKSVRNPVERTFRDLKVKTEEAYESSIHMVQENPVKSIAIALGLGMAAGYLLKRR